MGLVQLEKEALPDGFKFFGEARGPDAGEFGLRDEQVAQRYLRGSFDHDHILTLCWSPDPDAVLLVGGLRLFRPETLAPWGWKVRRQWQAWGDRPYMLVFGFCIGLGFLTTMASPVFIAVMMYGTTLTWSAVCLVFLWFAIGRLSTTWVTAIGDAKDGAYASRSADRVQLAIRRVGVMEGATAVAAGVALMLVR
ncbi:MAG: hypothetical protein V4531_03725 [Actinomycetota bacterium]